MEAARHIIVCGVDGSPAADLLVIGSHGHGTLHGKLLGSTSERVVHRAPCPVVIVPDPRLVERNVERAEKRQRRAEATPAVQVV